MNKGHVPFVIYGLQGNVLKKGEKYVHKSNIILEALVGII